MDSKQRAELIRKGNQAYNDGDFATAQKIFVATNYRDGLIRMGDWWYKKQRKPLVALGLYRRAGDKGRIAEIMTRMAMALKSWVRGTEIPKHSVSIPQVEKDKDPLYQKAMEILAREGESA